APPRPRAAARRGQRRRAGAPDRGCVAAHPARDGHLRGRRRERLRTVTPMSSAFSSPPSDFVLLASALMVDWLLGEPPSVLHPVVWMGEVARAAGEAVGGAER